MRDVYGSRPRRVCILTPGQVGSNPRVVKEADALHEAGFDVTVIATRTMELVEGRDRALMDRIGWKLQRIDLCSRSTRAPYRVVQASCRAAFRATSAAPFADLGFSAFTQPLVGAALRRPADLYIAHYPPALPAATAAAKRHGAAFAYDAEDFHSGDWPDAARFEPERAMLDCIERRRLPKAAYVTAASPLIAAAYAETYGIATPQVVLNVFPLAQAPRAPTPRGSAQPGPSLYWFSQTIGPDRGLECAVGAISRARSRPHLYLRGSPVPGYVEALRALATTHGAEDRLHVLPPAAPDAMETLASTFDLGLCSEPATTRNNRLALSNKLFTFLLAGTAPLLSATPAQSAFATDAGLGNLVFPVDDHDALAARLDALLLDPAQLADARHRAWSLGRGRHNWDAEKGRLVSLVADALAC